MLLETELGTAGHCSESDIASLDSVRFSGHFDIFRLDNGMLPESEDGFPVFPCRVTLV